MRAIFEACLTGAWRPRPRSRRVASSVAPRRGQPRRAVRRRPGCVRFRVFRRWPASVRAVAAVQSSCIVRANRPASSFNAGSLPSLTHPPGMSAPAC